MSYLEILPWIFIVIGVFLNFLVPILLKKRAETPDAVIEKIYITKSAGLILVIIGCIMIFWLGGRFGV